jgi:hypothetical protein
MTRVVLSVVAWMSLVSVATASLTARKEPARSANDVHLQRHGSKALAQKVKLLAQNQSAGGQTSPEYVMTDETEVLLNGKPCKYAQVPNHARIVKMEVGIDKRTVLKIHFRTGK